MQSKYSTHNTCNSGWSSFSKRIGLNVLLFVVPFVSFLATASEEDEYLKMLSEEISKPEYVTKIKQEIAQSEKEEKTEASKPGKKAKPDSFKDFEMNLVRKYPSSFKIYNDFKPKQKQEIYSIYASTNKMSKAKRKIIDIFLGLEK